MVDAVDSKSTGSNPLRVQVSLPAHRKIRPNGGIGRHVRFRCVCSNVWEFKSPFGHSMKMQKVIVVCGPTATGKSDFAVELAKKVGGEIISADSRQVYKGLDIGSGKITNREMKGVPHYLLDVASPKRVFSVAQYKRLADKAIKTILKRGNLSKQHICPPDRVPIELQQTQETMIDIVLIEREAHLITEIKMKGTMDDDRLQSSISD